MSALSAHGIPSAHDGEWGVSSLDASVIVGTAGAHGGVALGSWITALSQRRLAREAHRRTLVQARELAYVEYLAAFRRFRRFLLAEPVKVQIVERAGGRKTPVIEKSSKNWETVEVATARIKIVAAGRPVLKFAGDMRIAFYAIAEARATFEAGAVPDELVRAANDADAAFAQAAHDDLEMI